MFLGQDLNTPRLFILQSHK